MAQARPRKSLWQNIAAELRKNWGLYLLVAVPLAYLIIFKYWPMYGVQIAFREYKPTRTIWGSPWVGLKYIRKFVEYRKFWELIRNTFLISFYSLLTFPLPVILALLLNYMPSQRYKKTVQLVSYAPHFISTVVMVGILLQFLDTRSGLINVVITALGGKAVNFMAKPQYFRFIYVASGVWQGVGYNSIIYIAALSGVSPELHEAAIVDGADILKRVWHIDLPSILPTMAILLIMSAGSMLSVGYEKIYLMQNSLNNSVSEVISTYTYKQGIAASNPQYSYGAAIGLFISLVNVVLLLVVNRVTGKLSGSSLF